MAWGHFPFFRGGGGVNFFFVKGKMIENFSEILPIFFNKENVVYYCKKNTTRPTSNVVCLALTYDRKRHNMMLILDLCSAKRLI